MTVLTLRAILMAAAMAATGSVAVRAGGDDYDAAKDTENMGPAYFGFVRDVRGAAVPNARVVLRPKTGDAVVIKTNVLGLYRSHVRKGVAPDEVEVACDKDGYKQARVLRRTPPGAKDMFIETDCTLQKL